MAKQTAIVLKSSQNTELGKKAIGDSQPPKKHIATTAESHIMLEYSARKNMANVMPAYSTL